MWLTHSPICSYKKSFGKPEFSVFIIKWISHSRYLCTCLKNFLLIHLKTCWKSYCNRKYSLVRTKYFVNWKFFNTFYMIQEMKYWITWFETGDILISYRYINIPTWKPTDSVNERGKETTQLAHPPIRNALSFLYV